MRGFVHKTVAFCLLALAAAAMADPASVDITIQNRQFTPSKLTVPAHAKVLVTVHNRDSLPAEFESYDLSREVVVPPGASVKVYIGPLKPGKYRFFDDFNPSAEGLITAAESAGDN